jgi:hypothetical protein
VVPRPVTSVGVVGVEKEGVHGTTARLLAVVFWSDRIAGFVRLCARDRRRDEGRHGAKSGGTSYIMRVYYIDPGNTQESEGTRQSISIIAFDPLILRSFPRRGKLPATETPSDLRSIRMGSSRMVRP